MSCDVQIFARAFEAEIERDNIIFATVKIVSRGDETGRHTGLKILGGLHLVWVRFPPPASEENTANI